MSNKYPFIDFESSREIVVSSKLSKNIDEKKIEKMIEEAWNIGVLEAEKFQLEHDAETSDVQKIFKNLNLELIHKDKDEIVGNIRYYCDFYYKKKRVILYTKAIEKWAQENRLTNREAEKIILFHELFHYLEEVSIGRISERYIIPTLSIFGKTVLKSPFSALSEVSANAFALQMTKGVKLNESSSV